MATATEFVSATPTALIRKFFLSEEKKPGNVLEELKKLSPEDKAEFSRDIAKHYGGYHEGEGAGQKYFVPKGAIGS